jgi:hypothetical protein
MKMIYAATVAFLLSGGVAVAQGYPPGVNPSNPNDMTHRGNANDMTLPGAANPQDLVRSPSRPRVVSPGLPRDIPSVPPVSSALAHTHIDQPAKPPKKFVRRRHHLTEPQSE